MTYIISNGEWASDHSLYFVKGVRGYDFRKWFADVQGFKTHGDYCVFQDYCIVGTVTGAVKPEDPKSGDIDIYKGSEFWAKLYRYRAYAGQHLPKPADQKYKL